LLSARRKIELILESWLSVRISGVTDARVVIIAREVREGEDVSAIDTGAAYYNANPLKKQGGI